MSTKLIFKTESGKVVNEFDPELPFVAAVKTNESGDIIDQVVPAGNWVDNSREDSFDEARRRRGGK